MKLSHFKLAILLFSASFFSNCSKNNPNTVIPNVYVNIVLNINEPSSFELQPIGGFIYVNGGSNGLIVYRTGLDQFNCYDRHSTYNVNDWCQVEVDAARFKLIDTCSSSEFSIFDGSVIKGPATIPLKQYPTTFDGTYISITNQ